VLKIEKRNSNGETMVNLLCVVMCKMPAFYEGEPAAFCFLYSAGTKGVIPTS
jgi:hypothetical protein